jgi:hypothetical protein
MPNYQTTKIYYIAIPNSDKRYYGHTTQPLSKRRSEHGANFKRHPERKPYSTLREAGMTDARNIRLVLLECFPCDTFEQARIREQFHYDAWDPLLVVNKNRPHTTLEQHRQFLNHKMQIAYKNNPEPVKKRVREWRKNNPNRHREYQHLYRLRKKAEKASQE